MLSERAVVELHGWTIHDVSDSWARAVPAWCDFVRGGHDFHRDLLHGPALLDACGDVRGHRALDLGCGEGWCSRELAARGALVTGIDVCEEMIEAARSHPRQAHEPVEYLVMDAAEVSHRSWPAPLDLVTACMALHTMPEPVPALRAAREVLAPGGRIVCSIPHPMTHMVDDYFRSGAFRVRWDVPRAGGSWETVRWSRTLSEYTAMFRAAGFVIHELLEPCSSGAEIAEHPTLRDTDRRPRHLVLVAVPA